MSVESGGRSGASLFEPGRKYGRGLVMVVTGTFAQNVNHEIDAEGALADGGFNEAEARIDALIVFPALTAAQDNVQAVDVAGERLRIAAGAATFNATEDKARVKTSHLEGATLIANDPFIVELPHNVSRYAALQRVAAFGDVTRAVTLLVIARRSHGG